MVHIPIFILTSAVKSYRQKIKTQQKTSANIRLLELS